jgi:hypothetical protein
MTSVERRTDAATNRKPQLIVIGSGPLWLSGLGGNINRRIVAVKFPPETLVLSEGSRSTSVAPREVENGSNVSQLIDFRLPKKQPVGESRTVVLSFKLLDRQWQIALLYADLPILIALKTASEDPMCAICLDVVSTNSKCFSLPCKHIFHPNCLHECLRHSKLCPLCRSLVVLQTRHLLGGTAQ